MAGRTVQRGLKSAQGIKAVEQFTGATASTSATRTKDTTSRQKSAVQYTGQNEVNALLEFAGVASKSYLTMKQIDAQEEAAELEEVAKKTQQNVDKVKKEYEKKKNIMDKIKVSKISSDIQAEVLKRTSSPEAESMVASGERTYGDLQSGWTKELVDGYEFADPDLKYNVLLDLQKGMESSVRANNAKDIKAAQTSIINKFNDVVGAEMRAGKSQEEVWNTNVSQLTEMLNDNMPQEEAEQVASDVVARSMITNNNVLNEDGSFASTIYDNVLSVGMKGETVTPYMKERYDSEQVKQKRRQNIVETKASEILQLNTYNAMKEMTDTPEEFRRTASQSHDGVQLERTVDQYTAQYNVKQEAINFTTTYNPSNPIKQDLDIVSEKTGVPVGKLKLITKTANDKSIDSAIQDGDFDKASIIMNIHNQAGQLPGVLSAGMMSGDVTKISNTIDTVNILQQKGASKVILDHVKKDNPDMYALYSHLDVLKRFNGGKLDAGMIMESKKLIELGKTQDLGSLTKEGNKSFYSSSDLGWDKLGSVSKVKVRSDYEFLIKKAGLSEEEALDQVTAQLDGRVLNSRDSEQVQAQMKQSKQLITVEEDVWYKWDDDISIDFSGDTTRSQLFGEADDSSIFQGVMDTYKSKKPNSYAMFDDNLNFEYIEEMDALRLNIKGQPFGFAYIKMSDVKETMKIKK